MPVAVYRVVNRDGWTVGEYVVGPRGVSGPRTRAIRHAARIGGKVYHVSEDG